MKDYPDSFWATLFIAIASGLAVVALYAPGGSERNAVVTMASSIITGAFGYIQGKKAAEHSVQVPLNPSTSTSVTVDPTSAPPGQK